MFCRSLQRRLQVLPPRGQGLTTESPSSRRLLGSPACTRTPGRSRWSPRIGGWKAPGSGPPAGPPEPRRGDCGGHAAGCPVTGAELPAGEAGLVPPGSTQWPPSGRHYSPPLSPNPPTSSVPLTRPRRSGGVYKRAQEPRPAPHCASASPGAQRSWRPP
uniref:Solute carrier family 7 (Cationic amino acid transporter, y+ system), member 6 n=1 Tax=Pan troglodytes TaxID=9598 RepID=K7CQQ1_PANTR